MLETTLNDDKFADIMQKHVYECVGYLLENDVNFSIMANLSFVGFEPPLPDKITKNFNRPAIVFMLGGYTFESAVLTPQVLTFEAGFGSENFASVVSVPLNAIVQIAIEDNPILVNFAIPKHKKSNNKNLQKSISIFKSNPNNNKALSKK